MIKIPGYEITETIYEDSMTLVYRAVKKKNKKKVIIKIPITDFSSIEDINNLKHEYNIIKDFKINGIIKPLGIENYKNTFMLVLEDFKGKSLNKIILKKKIKISDFLNIATQLTHSLGEIHSNNIIHQDIKPANIIYNEKTGILKITDFSISRVFSWGNQQKINPHLLTGTIAYMSPEQSGRMNRLIDYRTDFYSLGITFYEILCGKPPFQSSDPMELIYSHIARTPINPNKHNPEIPKVLSDIVMKLLSKNPEDRYQSTYGLEFDLKKCISRFETTGTIEYFKLGTKDISYRFLISKKLYGRENEIKQLFSTFTKVSRGSSQILLIEGHSGIGKSALVHEIHSPIIEKRGYYISGKYDKFKRNIPYYGLFEAFKELINQILTESNEKISLWKKNLLKAFGPNGQIIIDIIPEIELIVGKQPPVQNLNSTQAQNRFNLISQNFIKVFAQKNHPLIIFLDDLQWIDSASLKLIELFMNNPENKHLLLIGAYRNNEVEPSHPLMLTLDKIKKSKETKIEKITLTPLKQENVNQLIKDTFQSKKGNSKSLSKLIIDKTNGNPFFINQFLRSLYDEKLLSFNHIHGTWNWSIEKISAKNITNNVIDLMVERIKKLPNIVQETLKTASCIGNQFDFQTLVKIDKKSPDQTQLNLDKVVQKGFLIKFQNIYSFAHDRIREATSLLIQTKNKQKIHLEIGYELLQKYKKDEIEENISDIVNHLNYSSDFIKNKNKRYELADLNLQAGKKAKASIAYEAALQYFSAGTALLDIDSWENDYELTFNLFLKRAECEYVNTNFNIAEKLFNLIISNAKTDLDKAKASNIRVVLYTNIGKIQEALDCGIDALKLFGMKINQNPGKLSIIKEILKTKLFLKKKNVNKLIDLPYMKDPGKIMAMNIAMNLAPPAYFLSKDLLTLLSLKMLNYSLKNGNSPFSSYTYSMSAMIFGSGLHDYKTGFEFGMLALKINSNHSDRLLECKNNFLFGNHINHWRRPVKTDIEFLLEGFQAGRESGDLIYAGFSANMYILILIGKGSPLSESYKEAAVYSNFIKQTKNPTQLHVCYININFILSLSGIEDDSSIFSDGILVKKESLKKPNLKKDNWASTDLFIHYVSKLKIAYILNNFTESEKYTREALKYVDAALGLFISAEFYFYYSLTLSALYPKVSNHEKMKYLKILKSNHKKMKVWSENCPENFENMYNLMSAEIAKIKGRHLESADYYDKAISSAHKNNFIQNAAIANECASRYYLSINKQIIAYSYMKEAYLCYLRWGANVKINNLKQKYPDLLTNELITLNNETTDYSSSSTTTDKLDLTTILNVSQNISSEIDLEKLIIKLVNVVNETAGAQRTLFIMYHGDNLFIEAEGKVDKETEILKSLPLESSNMLPLTIINYVTRTHNNVVINDTENEIRFRTDPYIIKKKPKSILCMQIIKQTKSIGILYLENNLTTHAFTPNRMEILNMLSSQAAISLDHARLYEDMKLINLKLEQEIIKHKKTAKDKENLQNKLIQAQKMEAIGHLAGGVAHDFNNILSAILGYTELSIIKLPKNNITIRSYLDIIIKSIEKATGLVKQLLAFSRKQVLEMKVINLNDIVNNTVKMLSRIVSEEIHIIIDTEQPIKNVMADPVQMEQVIMNLIVNSKDAMPDGGEIRIKTKNLILDNEKIIKRKIINPGSYVVMSISDTGLGISEEIQERIFEPFFTTKELGKGTGFGLSTVYGIVKQHNGYIYVDSKKNKGTSFQVYLPTVKAKIDSTEIKNKIGPGNMFQGNETILLVEDESYIKHLVANILQPLGYNILKAASGKEAIQISDSFDKKIDLLLTDVIMPEMNGRALSKVIISKRPDIKVIFMSGYTDDLIIKKGILEKEVAYIQKPLTIQGLTEKIRQVLDN